MVSMQPKENSTAHPIRLIRDRYKQAGFKQLGTAVEFARLIGCSNSLVRNTESGIVPMTERLAHLIQRGTGVSARWLLDAVKQWEKGRVIQSAKIEGVLGGPWIPSKENTLPKVSLIDALEFVYQNFPDSLPQFGGVLLEAILKVSSPMQDGSRPYTAKTMRRRYLDRYFLPVIGMLDDRDDVEAQEFAGIFQKLLEKRDGIEGTPLAKVLEVMFARDQRPSFVVEPRFPKDSDTGAPQQLAKKTQGVRRKPKA